MCIVRESSASSLQIPRGAPCRVLENMKCCTGADEASSDAVHKIAGRAPEGARRRLATSGRTRSQFRGASDSEDQLAHGGIDDTIGGRKFRSHGRREKSGSSSGGNSVCWRVTQRSWGELNPLVFPPYTVERSHLWRARYPRVLLSSTSNHDPCDSGEHGRSWAKDPTSTISTHTACSQFFGIEAVSSLQVRHKIVFGADFFSGSSRQRSVEFQLIECVITWILVPADLAVAAATLVHFLALGRGFHHFVVIALAVNCCCC